MRAILLLSFCLICTSAAAQALSAANEEWDLVQTYEASSHVFYGELTKILPAPDFKVGTSGVHIKEVDDKALRLEPLVWPKAKELSFSVDDAFKQPLPASFVAWLADPHPDLWSHVATDSGDVYLVKPPAPDPLFAKLQPGDRGLFFVRAYPGSSVPVLHSVRLGQQALADLALLRANRSAPNATLADVVEQARAREAAIARKEAAEFKALEDDYYKILRIQDLDIRTSLLEDLVERMGFEGRWSYFEFKERYLEERGKHIGDKAVPSKPTDGREKLWHDISGELRKIEVIQKAREAGSSR